MAKKLRKQISRALKCRFASFEKDLQNSHDFHVDHCGYIIQETSQKISAIYSDYANKMLLIEIGFFIIASVLIAFSSCNVTRVVTTSSEYFQRGDTSCMIQTKTVETYDAQKKL